MPTVSSPISSTRARRPVATSSRSPVTSSPSGKWSTNRPSESRSADDACSPRRSSIPSSRSAVATASPTDEASRGSSPGAPSHSVTSLPKRRKACDSSTPTGPPPSTTRLAGSSLNSVASRFVHTPSRSRRPSIGGITGDDPVAITIRSVSYTSLPTATRPGPSILPSPRSRSMPLSSSQPTAPVSSQDEVMKSRYSSALARSIEPVTASAAPATSRAASSASPGRSSVFDGMHAQYEHSPPTSSRSTIATRMPPSASSPAHTCPTGPAPMTIAS